VNEGIRSAQVYLIGPKGENIGVVPIQKALQAAHDAELDLVEVAPEREPPVCKVLDFGKFLYERTKKEREARKSQTKIEVKEIRLRPKTTAAHRAFKVDDGRRWLKQGHKVRVTIRFRGREIDYPEIALEDLREVAESLSDIAMIETPPALEGKNMSMVLVLAKPGKKKSEESAKKGESAKKKLSADAKKTEVEKKTAKTAA
jgi:translation initiation factor IF-3